MGYIKQNQNFLKLTKYVYAFRITKEEVGEVEGEELVKYYYFKIIIKHSIKRWKKIFTMMKN